MECELQEYGDRIFQRNGAAVRLNTVLRSLAVRRMMKRYRGCVGLGFMSVNAAKLFAARDIELDTLRLTLWVEAQSNEADANLAEEDEAARIVQGLLQGHISRCVMKANPQSRWVDAIIDYRPIISHPHAQEQHRARGALLEELVAKHGHRSQAPSCGFFPFTAKHEMLAQLEAPSAEPEGFLEDQQHMPADPVVSEQPHKNLYAVDEDDEDFQEALEAEQVALALRTPSKPIAASAAPIEMNADFVWEERCPSVNLEASRAWALYAEGQNAHFGFGAVPDLAKAEDCFRRSAQLGHTEAAYDLGLLLLHKGKPTQKESSLMWWKMAAQKGHIKAQEAHDQYIKSALRQANSKFSGFSVFDSFMSFCLESTKGSFVN